MSLKIFIDEISNEKITITPIGSSKKISKAKIDYEEQLSRTHNESVWCWDDSEHNKALKGELFAFYFPKTKKYSGKVIIHRIISVKNPSERLPSWSLNIGQNKRNVLELTNPLEEFTMDEWIKINGLMKQQGTYNSILSKRPFLKKILSHIK